MGGKRKGNKQTGKRASAKRTAKNQDETSVATKKSLNQSNEYMPSDLLSAVTPQKWRMPPKK